MTSAPVAAAVPLGGGLEGLVANGPRGRNLTPTELADLVVSIGRKTEIWHPHADHDPKQHSSIQLHVDPHLEIWLLHWTNGQATERHDHDQAAGAFYLCEGS
jgi:Cysteine dioxygenase type I